MIHTPPHLAFSRMADVVATNRSRSGARRRRSTRRSTRSDRRRGRSSSSSSGSEGNDGYPLAFEVLANVATRDELARASVRLGRLATQERLGADKILTQLFRTESELTEKTDELSSVRMELSLKSASLVEAHAAIDKMSTPTTTSLKIVRSACLRVAEHHGGCSVCHQPLSSTDNLLTAHCLHPAHKRCGEKWRQARRGQRQKETCPGCAATIEIADWCTVPSAPAVQTP